MARVGGTAAAAITYICLAALQRGVSLLILPFVTHAMSPSQYGAVSTMSAASLLITAIIATPLVQLIVRAAARGEENGPALLRAAGMYCYFIVPIAMLPVAAIAAFLIHDFLGVPGTIWGIEILAIGFQPAASTFALPVTQARQDLRRFVLISLASVTTIAVAKILFVVVLRLGVLGWAVSDLVSSILAALFAIAVIRLPRAKVDSEQIRHLMRFTVPLIPHSAAFWALLSLSRPAMAAVSSLDQVGLFSVGLNLASVAYMVLAESNRALLPRYSRELFPSPTAETLGPVRWQLIAALTVPAMIGAGVALTGRWILAPSYWPAFLLTGVLLIAQTAYGLYLIPMNFLTQTAGITRYSALASGAGTVVILLGILIFGRRFGALGVAFTTVASFVAMAAVALILTMKHRLDIAWHQWVADGPAILSAVAALTFSVAALASTVGSIRAFAFSGGSLVLALGSGFLASRTAESTRWI
jgi:O-antigen/teichoic acid export membrane protein